MRTAGRWHSCARLHERRLHDGRARLLGVRMRVSTLAESMTSESRRVAMSCMNVLAWLTHPRVAPLCALVFTPYALVFTPYVRYYSPLEQLTN